MQVEQGKTVDKEPNELVYMDGRARTVMDNEETNIA